MGAPAIPTRQASEFYVEYFYFCILSSPLLNLDKKYRTKISQYQGTGTAWSVIIIIISRKAHGDVDVDRGDLAWGYNSPLKTSVDMPLSCVLVPLDLFWLLTCLHIIYYITYVGLYLWLLKNTEWNAGLRNVSQYLNPSYVKYATSTSSKRCLDTSHLFLQFSHL